MKTYLKVLTYVVLLVLTAHHVISGSTCSKYNSSYDNKNLESSGSYGTIISPNYPSNYNDNMDCVWIITVPANHHIKAEFTTFVLQGQWFFTCVDYVELHDGSSSSYKSLGKLCDKHSSMVITSTGSTMRVAFHSDGWLNNKGFSMTYKAVENDSGLSAGVLAGIIIAVVVCIIVIIVLSICCCCQKTNTQAAVVHNAVPQQTATVGTTVMYTQNQQHPQVQFIQAPQTQYIQASQTQYIQTLPQTQIIHQQQPPPYQHQYQQPPPQQQPPPAHAPSPGYQVPGAPDCTPATLPKPPPAV